MPGIILILSCTHMVSCSQQIYDEQLRNEIDALGKPQQANGYTENTSWCSRWSIKFFSYDLNYRIPRVYILIPTLNDL